MEKSWLFDREAEANYFRSCLCPGNCFLTTCFENYSVGQVAPYYLLRENGLKGDTLHILEGFLFVFETRSKY